ncbi:MAG: TIGR00266 family protein [Myxococcota bacterium]
MKYAITHSPAFSKLDVELDEGEQIYAQPNSMLCMTPGIKITAQMGGTAGRVGVMGGIKGMLSGESFFTSVFTSRRQGAQVSLVPDAVGELVALQVTASAGLCLTSGAFLAAQQTVTLDTQYAGLKGWMAQKGLFLLHCRGEGTVFVASYGAVVHRTLQAEERFVVDNRFVVAFSDTVKYELVTATKDLSDSIMSGEGLVNRYTGPGELYYQTRARPRPNLMTTILNLTS